MFFGRPFAYLHIPGIPVYIGEVVLAIGALEGSRRLAVFRGVLRRNVALRVLLTLLTLTFVRLAMVDLQRWGLDAVRDAALVYYALNALLVAAVLHANPGLLGQWLRWYERVLPFYLCYAPLSVILHILFSGVAPRVPDSDTAITLVKSGDVGVFCAMAVAYIWLRQRREDSLLWRNADRWSYLGLFGLLVAGTQNRGGMISGVLILACALAVAPRRAFIFFRVFTTLGVLLLVVLAADIRFDLGRRELSVDQLLANVNSIGGQGDVNDEGALQGTVEWRLAYWSDIANENLVGDRALTGLGWGENLALRYNLPTPSGEQMLRNAHNSHMSVVARLGVPGLALWLALWGVLFFQGVSLARRMLRRGERARGLVLLWILSSLAGILMNAIFDPTLEGPQIGIWLWTLVGVALQGRRLVLADDADPRGPATAPRLAHAGSPTRWTRA